MSEVKKLRGDFEPIGDQVIVLVPVIKTKLKLTTALQNELSKQSFKPLEVVAAGKNTGLVKGDFVLRKEGFVPSFLPEFDSGVEGFEYGVFSLHQILTKVSNLTEVTFTE